MSDPNTVGPAPSELMQLLLGNPTSGTVRVQVRGEVDCKTAGRLEEFLCTQLLGTDDGRLSELVVDLADTAFIGAAGLHAIERAQHYARDHAIKFRISGAGSFHARLLATFALIETQ